MTMYGIGFVIGSGVHSPVGPVGAIQRAGWTVAAVAFKSCNCSLLLDSGQCKDVSCKNDFYFDLRMNIK